MDRRAIRTLALTIALASSAAGNDGAADDAIPFGKVQIPSAGVEIPVPLDWIRLPVGSGSGAEAQYVSVKDMAELDVFSVPFQADFREPALDDRAAELMAFASPLSKWTAVTTSRARAGEIDGVMVRASWNRGDQPADVLALAFPTRGRSAIILLIMAHGGGGPFGKIADLLAARTTVTALPEEVGGSGTSAAEHRDPRGFSLSVPPAWRRVSTTEIEVMASTTGGDGEPGQDLSTVGFVRPALARQSPNMIVDVSEAPTVASEAGRREMEERYRIMVGQRGSDFTLDSVSVVHVASIASLLAVGRMEAPGGTVLQSQYFVPFGSRTLIVTVSLPERVVDDVEPEVRRILDSIALEGYAPTAAAAADPAPAKERDLLPWAAGGASVLAVLALVVVMASRRRGRPRGPAS